ncbi:hypothetical protein VPH35_011980 [Triticum aestivum]
MERLRLTAVEAQPVILDDEDEADLVALDCALVGKVMSPNPLHIQTISSAMRPAWGNPKGLLFHPSGNNVFVAEFGTQADRARMIEGSPWMVGKHAVLLKVFDQNVKPLQVRFDRLAIWARIMNQPPRLMKAKLGREFAKPIGQILSVESDSDGRCWGGFMRVRTEINVHEPIVRYITMTSLKLKSTETFSVMYERLPFVCFSCGILGHSLVMCPTPGLWDENGDLPYAAKKLCVNDEHSRRSGGSRSSAASSSSATTGDRAFGNSKFEAAGYVNSSAPDGMDTAGGDVSSPIKFGVAARGRGRTFRGRGRGRASDPSRELFSSTRKKSGAAGQKRKSGKASTSSPSHVLEEDNTLALVPVPGGPVLCHAEAQDTDLESNKKQRISELRSADPAEAAAQPRQTQ